MLARSVNPARIALCILAAGMVAMFLTGDVPFEDQNLWNTLITNGMAGTGVSVIFLYPLSLLCAVCPGSLGIEIFLGSHVLLAAIGTFLLVHRWTGCRTESILAAGGAALCVSQIISWLPLNAVAATACIPPIIWLGDRASMRDNCAIIPLACAVAAQMLTGYLAIILLTWLALATLSLDVTQHHVRDSISSNAGPGLGSVAHRLTAVLLIASGLCATQVLPFLI